VPSKKFQDLKGFFNWPSVLNFQNTARPANSTGPYIPDSRYSQGRSRFFARAQRPDALITIYPVIVISLMLLNLATTVAIVIREGLDCRGRYQQDWPVLGWDLNMSHPNPHTQANRLRLGVMIEHCCGVRVNVGEGDVEATHRITTTCDLVHVTFRPTTIVLPSTFLRCTTVLESVLVLFQWTVRKMPAGMIRATVWASNRERG